MAEVSNRDSGGEYTWSEGVLTGGDFHSPVAWRIGGKGIANSPIATVERRFCLRGAATAAAPGAVVGEPSRS